MSACSNLKKRGWLGQLDIDDMMGKLIIRVKAEGAKTAHQDLKTLSGGERSFITICFLLALGKQLQASFHCLDEFDVFMDSVSQGVSCRPALHSRHSCSHFALQCEVGSRIALPGLMGSEWAQLQRTTDLTVLFSLLFLLHSAFCMAELTRCRSVAAEHDDAHGVCSQPARDPDGSAHAAATVSHPAGGGVCTEAAASRQVGGGEVHLHKAPPAGFAR